MKLHPCESKEHLGHSTPFPRCESMRELVVFFWRYKPIRTLGKVELGIHNIDSHNNINREGVMKQSFQYHGNILEKVYRGITASVISEYLTPERVNKSRKRASTCQ